MESDPVIPFSLPCIDDSDVAAVTAVLRSGWLARGPVAAEFERAFATRVDAPGALALASCTAGLHLALMLENIGPGDEVITTPFTFAATVNVIEQVGARPVLVDIERDTLNLDPHAVARALGPRTKAILPVHFAGHPADLDALAAYGKPIIEDAAHAFPATYRGRAIGSGPNPVSFSFYATKNITTGEGGMLTASPDRVARARILAGHGIDRDAAERGGEWSYAVVAPGLKYGMCDLQAALGLSQLRKQAAFRKRRLEIVRAYDEAFRGEQALEAPTVRSNVESSHHLYVLRLLPGALRIGRDAFIDELRTLGIRTSVHFIPVHLHPFYRDKYGYRPDDYPVAHAQFGRALSLPLHPGLSDAQVARIVDGVLSVTRRHRR